jgi:hypothetical protein
MNYVTKFIGELVNDHGQRIIGGYTGHKEGWMWGVMERWNASLGEGQERADGFVVRDLTGKVTEYN